MGLALLMLSACGMPGPFRDLIYREESSALHTSTDPIFNPYVNLFESKMLNYSSRSPRHHVPINFGDTTIKDGEAKLGLCLLYSGGQREIIVNKTWWNSAPEARKEALIFHELGHCQLERVGHRDARLSHEGRSYSLSLMNTYLPSESEYRLLKEGYLKELFSEDDSLVRELIQSL